MNIRILVIDDDEAVRKSFILALEDTAYHVDTVESGEKGIERVEELRQLDILVPVYIVTAFHKEFFKDLKLLSEDGIAFDLLRKPIGSDEIVELTNSMLTRKK